MKEGLWLLIVRKGKAFVPTMARTEAGFYMGIDPVEVVDISDQTAVEQAMFRMEKTERILAEETIESAVRRLVERATHPPSN